MIDKQNFVEGPDNDNPWPMVGIIIGAGLLIFAIVYGMIALIKYFI